MKLKSLTSFLKKKKPPKTSSIPNGGGKSTAAGCSTSSQKHLPKHKGQRFSNNTAVSPSPASTNHSNSLNDKHYIQSGPGERLWIQVDESLNPSASTTSGTSSSSSSGSNSDNSKLQHEDPHVNFSVMTYNILCQNYTAKYTYTPPSALALPFREQLAMREIRHLNPDILCLQEVSGNSYNSTWLPMMRTAGYEGLYKQKSSAANCSPSHVNFIDGCATFFKKSLFGLLEERTLEYSALVSSPTDPNSTDSLSDTNQDQELFNSKDNIERLAPQDHVGIITVLRHLESSERIMIANTHLFWDPKYADVKTLQACLLAEEVERTARKYQNHASTSRDNQLATPIIICGDFNSLPSSDLYGVYSGSTTLATLKEQEGSDLHGRDYGRFTDPVFKWNIARQLSLKSAYTSSEGEQLIPFTNFTPDFTAVIDYLWYSTATLAVEAVLGQVDPQYVKQVSGFPSEYYPSDHISIMAKFKLKVSGNHH